ncbi:transglutaminase domain-containing protein [Methanobrevibacter sp. V74]|uniref:transglutaminase domain-containing protein n=1 Tax=Methanobrevibacter sp. V74 TaxID=3064279 RepID=UPI002736B4D7|nr:transglutaminase domain-containing protein [Methanobrevibacter sp. V74]
MIAQDSLARSGLEIYKTKDSNVEKVSDEEDKEGLVLQNGTIIEIDYFNEMFSNSFDYDYEDISSNGSVKLPSVDDTIFYKGKKILLKKEWNPQKWEDLKNCLLGFITEQKYSEDGVEIKISGMSKLLDQKKEFSFTKTKRSKILKNIIESAGLKANINTKGLKDEKINYRNVSSSGTSFSGSEQVNSLVQRAVGNETDDYKKMELINKEVNNVLTYSNYPCSKCSTPEEVLSKKKVNCADTSLLECACMKAANLNATVVHGCNHFWTVVTINGKEYACDATNSRGIGYVWNCKTRNSEKVSGGGPYHKKNGDKPDC